MTSENTQSCDFTEDYLEFRKLLFARDSPIRHLFCGSFFELPLVYSISNPTDIDVMFCDMTLSAIYDNTDMPKRYVRTVFTIKTRNCHAGFVRLRNGIDYFLKPYQFDNGKGPAYISKLPTCILNACFKDLLGNINTRWGGIRELTKDSVYAISCPMWPPEAHEWITRKRLNGWPSEETIRAIVKNGCHLVSKPHGRNPNDDTQWRYSFSQAETILIHDGWTGVQKYIYHLLRIIKRDIASKCESDTKAFMSNYYIKTLMLWACEEKPSEFWKDENEVTSVRELLLDFIVYLIQKNFPHYFIPTNNLMDEFPCNVNVENEISSLISYGEQEISEIIRQEPKAYQMNPCVIVVSNGALYPLANKLSDIYEDVFTFTSLRFRKCIGHFDYGSNCTHDELKYLLKGIMMHLQLLSLDSYETRKRRQAVVTLAEDFFDLSIKKVDYGFTRIRLKLDWSIFELSHQLWVLCENLGKENPMPYSRLCEPRSISTSCYVRNPEHHHWRNQRSFSNNRIETSYSFLETMFNEITVNATYVLCSAYKANFLCNALLDYRRALDLCEEVNRTLNCSAVPQCHFNLLFAEFLPFPLRNEWSGLYDKYVQIVFGFLTLHRMLVASPKARKRMIPMRPVYICPIQYLSYIYTRCCGNLNEPIADFGLDYERFNQREINILKYTMKFSKAILQTALFISIPNFV